MTTGKSHKPSQADLDRRKTAGVNSETVTNIYSTDFPGHYPGEDHAWDLDEFKKRFTVQFHYNEDYDSSFSLIGIDASVANAFRRILIGEVPTFAIHNVYILNNTSIVQDEILAQRLGLIPLTGSAEGFKELTSWVRLEDDPENLNVTDRNTLILNLKIKCTRNTAAARDEDDPLKLYHNAHIYAKDLEFEPLGNQAEWFSEEKGPVRAFNPDILIAKMRPGQEIDLIAHCHKNNGTEHAKWSPVATASYRLMPSIQITKPIYGEDAKKFARCFARGVIGLETVTEENSSDGGADIGKQRAVVQNPFIDTVSRECLRHEEFKDKVKLGRVKDHFIFSIESTGQYKSDQLFLESLQVLKTKIRILQRNVEMLGE